MHVLLINNMVSNYLKIIINRRLQSKRVLTEYVYVTAYGVKKKVAVLASLGE